ncbi:hypothetical protein EVA_22027, partial [gut metagenome]
DSDLVLVQESEKLESNSANPAETPKSSKEEQQDDTYWNGFLQNLETSDKQTDKSERLVCRLDRDLADSLDDCVIYNRSRSDMVNAIVRTFFNAYLPQ